MLLDNGVEGQALYLPSDFISQNQNNFLLEVKHFQHLAVLKCKVKYLGHPIKRII